MLEDLRSLCRAAQAFCEQHGSGASLTGFLDHAAGLHAEEVRPGEDRRITVSTIHRAKGTEAQLVVLLACEEQLLPSWRALESPDPEDLAEERRLFYVAATRAKDRLVITRAHARAGRATGGPSRFLTEAGLLAAPRGAGRLTRPSHSERSTMHHAHPRPRPRRSSRPPAPTRRRPRCSGGRSRPARSAFAP